MTFLLKIIPQLTIGAVDLAAAFLFTYGLKRMSSPVTAPSGIKVAGLGMAVAILVSFFYAFDVGATAKPLLMANIGLALIALAIGGGLAWFGALIGAVSLSGSLIAGAKLDGVIKKPLRIRGQQIVNGLVAVATLAVGGYIVAATHGLVTSTVATPELIYIFFGAALLFGVLMTLPIGGADMPVVISIYNAFTGLAVGLEGFVLQNPALMIAGMVVGAAGTLLTLLMAKAMNRSISNILFTNFGAVVQQTRGEIKGSLKPVEASDAGIFMRYPPRSSLSRATVWPWPKAAEALRACEVAPGRGGFTAMPRPS